MTSRLGGRFNKAWVWAREGTHVFGEARRDAVLGATWVVEATISLGTHSTGQMVACRRGPGTGSAPGTDVTAVMAMLRSLRFDR